AGRRLCALEVRRPLLDEGEDPLLEVARGRHLLLDVGLQLKLLSHPRVDAVVELALGPGERPGRTLGEPLGQFADVGVELAVEHPMPTAGPLTAARTGLGISRMPSMIG